MTICTQSDAAGPVHHRQVVLPGGRYGHHDQGQAGEPPRGAHPGGRAALHLPGQLHRVRHPHVLRHRAQGEHGQLRRK